MLKSPGRAKAPWHLPLDFYGMVEDGYHHSALLLANLEQHYASPSSTAPVKARIPPRKWRTRR